MDSNKLSFESCEPHFSVPHSATITRLITLKWKELKEDGLEE